MNIQDICSISVIFYGSRTNATMGIIKNSLFIKKLGVFTVFKALCQLDVVRYKTVLNGIRIIVPMKIILGIVLSMILLGMSQAHAQDTIPIWVKNTALWWGQDKITDGEFFSMMQFLVDRKIITVSDQNTVSSDAEEIRQELEELRRHSIKDIQDAFDDGYEKGSRSFTVYDSDAHYQSCDKSLLKYMSGISDENFVAFVSGEIAYMDETGYPTNSRYWDAILSNYLAIQQDEKELYVADCPGTASQDQLNLIALQLWYTDPDLTTRDACSSNLSRDKTDIDDCVRLLDYFDRFYVDESTYLLDESAGYSSGEPDNTFTTEIKATEVYWSLYDQKGNFYSWVMPVSTYESLILDSEKLSEYNTYTDPLLLEHSNGETFSMISLEGFVYKEAFSDIIDDLYDNSHSDSDFIWEIWNIVSKMTVYDEDVHENSEGRYALETLTRTGGDCEDLAILIANMLYSSSHTKDWTIQYVYMDLENPEDPVEVDHVIVYVNNGTYDYFIEATGSPSWDYYPNGVNGWYFDVV